MCTTIFRTRPPDPRLGPGARTGGRGRSHRSRRSSLGTAGRGCAGRRAAGTGSAASRWAPPPPSRWGGRWCTGRHTGRSASRSSCRAAGGLEEPLELTADVGSTRLEDDLGDTRGGQFVELAADLFGRSAECGGLEQRGAPGVPSGLVGLVELDAVTRVHGDVPEFFRSPVHHLVPGFPTYQ